MLPSIHFQALLERNSVSGFKYMRARTYVDDSQRRNRLALSFQEDLVYP